MKPTNIALISVKNPCQHSLEALRALVDSRELRKLGIPREARIKRAMSDLEDRIRVMFIFGSSARGKQSLDSDIDLMILGNVSLKELSRKLKQAEQELGKQVNAVIYSEGEWRKRCEQRDDFVMNVLKDKKIFVLGDNYELAAMAGE